MEMFSWILGVFGSLFGLFETITILGIPLYVYVVSVFVLGSLANFIYGRK